MCIQKTSKTLFRIFASSKPFLRTPFTLSITPIRLYISTALILASYWGRTEIVKILVNKKELISVLKIMFISIIFYFKIIFGISSNYLKQHSF